MGIRSVAVYSDADVDARHVAEADTAVRARPRTRRQSYLDIDAVVNAARRTGAQAVHPGYGFLCREPDFAAALQRAGIIFIGPPAAAIRDDGRQDRRQVGGVGLRRPGGARHRPPGLTDAELISAADDIGFPILVKPSAAGAARACAASTPRELPAALVSARRESARVRGRHLFLERFVLRPRHIEVQVLADGYGTVLHLGERRVQPAAPPPEGHRGGPVALLDAGHPGADRGGRLRHRPQRRLRRRRHVEFIVSADRPTSSSSWR